MLVTNERIHEKTLCQAAWAGSWFDQCVPNMTASKKRLQAKSGFQLKLSAKKYKRTMNKINPKTIARKKWLLV